MNPIAIFNHRMTVPDKLRFLGGGSLKEVEVLRETINKRFGAEPAHRKSVPVKETWLGETVWNGVVEVFELPSHPKPQTIYAWLVQTGAPPNPPKQVTMLRNGSVETPSDAVRAFIFSGFRGLKTKT